MSEKPVVLPLTGAEIQNAILYKLAEDLEKSCHLSEVSAYSRFRAKISVHLVLEDYGREVPDNHIIEVEGGTSAGEEARVVDSEVTMAPEPPNQVRVATGQDVPVKVTNDGKTEIKKVRYQRRKPAAAR
jgi:hypothetical protein